MAKLLIRKDEMILLKHSEAGKNYNLYGNLYAMVQPYDVLSEDDFHKCEMLDDKARAVVLGNKKILFDEIKDEWIGVGCSDEATGEVRCQLCNTKNKLVFYIHNKLNDAELNVGSECIKKFPGIGNIGKIRRSHNEEVKHRAEIKRRIEFDEIDLSNINYIKDVEDWFTSFPILLSQKLFATVKKTIFSLNSLKTSYIKNGGEIVHIKQQYFELKKILETCKVDAEKFYNINKSNALSCKKSLADWLKDKHPDVWDKVLKNDGILNQETLKFCYATEFVESNLATFNTKILDSDITIVGMNGPLIRFVIKNNDYIYPLYFTMQSKDFMMNIGCYCLTDKNYSFGKNELTKVKLEQNNNNFDAMYNRILSPLEKVGLRIERGQYTGELYYVRLPRIIRSSKWSDRTETSEIGYKKISETIIYTKLDSLIFASDSEIQNVFSKILAQLNRTSKWIDKGEKEQMEQFSRSLYIQSQREFINYK